MKKALLVLLLVAAGYGIGTGAAATEWRAFRFWYANHEALPMLEARATWALDEFNTALPGIHWPALMTQADANSFAASLAEQFGPKEGSTPPRAPLYTMAELQLHRERSASFQSYANVREAAASPSFHQMTEDHMSMLGKRLDSGHTISVSMPMPLSVHSAPSANPADSPAPHFLEWHITLNLSTRERLRSVAHLIVPAVNDR